MSIVMLRRRKLGRTSCREISNLSETGIKAVRNDLARPRHFEDVDMVIRWGCTSTVPIRNVLNTARAIHEVNDKLGFRRKLEEAELGPKTWFNLGEWAHHVDPMMFVEEDGHLPLQEGISYIGRPARHAQGRNVHVITNTEHGAALRDRYGENNYYISELINKVAEYRVFVVQGRVACVAKKTPGNPQDVAWNVAKGGRFDNVRYDEWPLKAVRMSCEAFDISSLDFGGVDVMVDADGNAYILEINSAPSLTSPYRQQCMAKCFDYIVRNGKERIPMTEERGGWKKFIHPAISDRASIVGE